MTELETLPLHHLDLESIPNQIGHAILRSTDGSVIRKSGSLESNDIDILYKMLLEMGDILNANGNVKKGKKEELLKRVNVQGGNGVCYSMGVSKDELVYIVKKRSHV